MAKRGSTRKIRKHRLYTYQEAGDALGFTAHTMRFWRSAGLRVMRASVPHYVLGADLIAFCEQRKAKRSAPPNMDQMYCFTCKEPRKPLWGMVDYVPITESRGRLTGLCEVCEGALNRFAGKGDLGKFDQIYDITIKDRS